MLVVSKQGNIRENSAPLAWLREILTALDQKSGHMIRRTHVRSTVITAVISATLD